MNLTKEVPESVSEGLWRPRDGRDDMPPSPREIVSPQTRPVVPAVEPPGSDPAVQEPDHTLDALRFAASHLHECETVVPSDLLLRTATQHSLGQATFKEIEATYNRLVADGILLGVSGDMGTTNRLLRSRLVGLHDSRRTG